jgi:two-component system, cell cycle sensor histidine kinase and response regulator CckA
MAMEPTPADFRAMIESAPEAVIVYTFERFLYLNPFAAARLGSTPDKLVGERILDFVAPHSLRVVERRLLELARGEKLGEPVDVTFVAKDGTVIPAETVSIPIVFGGQRAFLGLIRDMSRRSETERALRESEERFANAFRQSPHGMAFVDFEGRWVRANHALCDMLGYTEEELRGRRFADMTHPDDVGTDMEQLRRLGAGEIGSYHRIKRYVRKDGRVIWVSLGVSAVHDSSGNPIYFIGQMEDITLRRAMEEERARGARLSGIVETTIAVAHEMNNALTVLMLNAELLAHDVNHDELPEISGEILTASASIATTVQRLRQLGDLQTVDYLGETKMLDLSSKQDTASE